MIYWNNLKNTLREREIRLQTNLSESKRMKRFRNGQPLGWLLVVLAYGKCIEKMLCSEKLKETNEEKKNVENIASNKSQQKSSKVIHWALIVRGFYGTAYRICFITTKTNRNNRQQQQQRRERRNHLEDNVFQLFRITTFNNFSTRELKF